MPESLKMVLVLTLISGVAGLGLAAMNEKTAPLIAENIRMFTLESINEVMPDTKKPDPCETYKPGFDNAPDQDSICINGTTVYRGRNGAEITGIAVKAIGDKAYSGTITVLVGIRMSDGLVTGIKVLEHKETPGLGSNMSKCEFKQQMVGLAPGDQIWKVAKDGGDIDQLSGATITSRSMLVAVTRAQGIWQKHKDQILSAPALEEGDTCDGK